MDKYPNRQEAGKILAGFLRGYANRSDVIVLALPRGGVPVAYEVAQSLNAPLDLFIVRKLGVPGQSELAMGAIASGGAHVFNPDILREMKVEQEEIDRVLAKEQAELARRERIYRGGRPYPDLKNKTVILIDDGIATGATVRAAIKALLALQPNKIVLAVPVAQKDMCDALQSLVDELIAPLRPVHLNAVGTWYHDFSQTEDEEVHRLMQRTL